MSIGSLSAISPVDGRYHRQTSSLSPFFSESALIRYRLRVEVEYFIALCEWPVGDLGKADKSAFALLRSSYSDFTEADALDVKNKERITNHDVKALEYFLKEKMSGTSLSEMKEFVHFGLTSQDINNTAFPLAIKEATAQVYLPELRSIIQRLESFAIEWSPIAMLSRTHGQPASPTRLGKEMMVFVERLCAQLVSLESIPFCAKFGGATGNFNAHHIAFPQVDWKAFADDFVSKKLGLVRLQHTTQIEHYDQLCALFDVMKRINNILIDLNRDIWTYISMDYFKQRIKEGEVGSSAMPHKVNPIDFENSEGNLGMANAIFEHLSAKLPISRLQRDLTDSTVLRNVGVPFAHSLIAFKSLEKGLDKLLVNKDAIEKDLQRNWSVVAEALQTILRREGVAEPYELLKGLTRTNKPIDKKVIDDFIDSLQINDTVKSELKSVTPFNYTGI
ncbi:MAG: adenylosuccinate lyase [Bacteroidota bacterium]